MPIDTVRLTFAPLRKHRLMALLVATQIVLASAILTNVLFLLWQRAAPMLADDGLPRNQLVEVDLLVTNSTGWTKAQIQAGTAMLRTIPGVEQVSPAIGLPMSTHMTFTVELDGPKSSANVSMFLGDNSVRALGLQVSKGREFSASDYFDMNLGTFDLPDSSPAIITEALARHLFGSADPIGQKLVNNDDDKKHTFVVIGIVPHLLRYQLGEIDDGRADYSIILPARITGTPILAYEILTHPGQQEQAIREIKPKLIEAFGHGLMQAVNPTVDRYETLRSSGFKSRRAAVWLLGTVCVVVALITLFGIASLSGYWIQQRTRQIGIRRALGATRAQVLRHFQLENLLVTLTAVALGMPLAYAANQLLMRHYELPRLPLIYLPIGALALLLLGQLAVLLPARRASSVPPATATRSI